MWQVALAATEQLPDPRPKALAHTCLGYFSALALFEQIGDLPGQALTHIHFCTVMTRTREDPDPRRGLRHAEHTRKLYHCVNHTAGESFALSALGWCHALLGEHQQARACCEQALTLARTLGSLATEFFAVSRLGLVLHHSGQYAEALLCHHQAVALCSANSNIYWRAVALSPLGDTHYALGQIAEAHQVWQHACDLYRAQHCTVEAERVQQKLAVSITSNRTQA